MRKKTQKQRVKMHRDSVSVCVRERERERERDEKEKIEIIEIVSDMDILLSQGNEIREKGKIQTVWWKKR